MNFRFQEPRLLIVADPKFDRQAIVEASYVNIPCIALADTDNSLEYVDVGIPCNNRSTESISMIFWLLAREVKILRGELGKGIKFKLTLWLILDIIDEDWDVMVDLFFYKSLEQVKVDEEDTDDVKEEKDKQVICRKISLGINF